ncbi:hypothetical protein WMF04_36890 [Sorangium sp. So ce260]|uniref:hypothetical protein n=1 Tax=Sorangium sp. So ce260 TaxID=3133291 RepID=UPI003F60B387
MSTRPSPIAPIAAEPSAPARQARRSVVPTTSMLLKPGLIACAACVGLAACSETSSTPSPERARFADRIAPLAAERCDGCHATAPGGSMAVYRTARSLVTPGKPDESLYYTLPERHPAAWGDAAGLVRGWIEAGAPE